MEEPDKNTVGYTDLWTAFKKGNRMAFEEMLQEYYESLLKYGLRITRFEKEELVKDTLQEFFVDLWNARNRLGEAVSVKAYLLSSFKRKLIRELARNKKIQSTDEPEMYMDFAVEFSIERSIIENEEKSLQKEKLTKLMNQLSKRQKEAIYLKYFEQLEYDEIAETMGIANHSVVNLVYGGIKILRSNWVWLMYMSVLNLF